jgi:predicted transcriptional regulator
MVTDEDGLSPHVAELLERVDAKVAQAASIAEIRELADKAMHDANGSTLTIAEIGELARVAIDRAQKVDTLVSRLAELVSEGSHDG